MKKLILLFFLTLYTLVFPEPFKLNEGHYDTITDIAKYPFGNIAITVSNDESVIIWDLSANKILESIELYKGTLTAVAISPGGEYFVVGNKQGTVFFFDYNTRELIGSEKLHTSKITSISFTQNETTFISAGLDSNIIVYDIAKRSLIRGLSMPTKIISFDISNDKKNIVAGGESGNLYIIPLNNNELGVFKAIKDAHTDWITSVSFSPDNQRIVSASWDLKAKVFNIRTLEVERVMHVPTEKALNSATWSIDNKSIAISSSDSNIYLYDTANFNLIDKLEGHGGKVTKSIFFPNSNNLVSIGTDAQLNYWNLKNGELEKIFTGY